MKPSSLDAALDYVGSWLDHQIRVTEQPGCTIAVAHKGRVVWEAAFGQANLGRGLPLTPRHVFRVASHSKSFTAAGILRLREQGKLRLDDPISRHLGGLHREIGEATISQLLSHSAGIVRDGYDCGQWVDRRPFLDSEELRADLAAGPILPPNTRFKYSNHGYGLLGQVIEAISGDPYVTWIQREVVVPAGLTESWPDVPVPARTPRAVGHSTKEVLGERRIIPGDNPTQALAAATGFVSTAADLAHFFAQLDPMAKRSVLGAASRREMVRRQWRSPDSSVERHYGLGIISGRIGDWEWFGHSGGFQGFITRTAVIPAHEVSVSVLTNAADGMAHAWLEGTVHVLRAFHEHGRAAGRTANWAGRWWGLWGAVDFVPMGKTLRVASPSAANPLLDAAVIELTGRDRGRIVQDGGFGSHGEEVHRTRGAGGKVRDVWFAGMQLTTEKRLAAEMERRYRRR